MSQERNERITMTPEIRSALDAVARAQKAYRAGGVSYSLVEIPKIALADAVLDAVKHHQEELASRAEGRLARLPVKGRAVPIFVGVERRQSERRRKRA